MVFDFRISTDLDSAYDVADITGTVKQHLESTPVVNGIVHLFVVGSTGALTTIEFEPGLVKDLKTVLEELAPIDGHYHHEDMWHDGNGFSHVRAALMKPSLSVPVQEGRITLGTWQQIVVLNFDNRPRRREVVMHVMGAEA